MRLKESVIPKMDALSLQRIAAAGPEKELCLPRGSRLKTTAEGGC
jgi:hypothetical protein